LGKIIPQAGGLRLGTCHRLINYSGKKTKEILMTREGTSGAIYYIIFLKKLIVLIRQAIYSICVRTASHIQPLALAEF
jgi:hypothetical protein